MNHFVRNIRVVFIILFVLIFSMFYVSPVFADDTPPPTETPEVVTTVEENNDQLQITEETEEESPAVEEIVDESQTDESASSTTTEVNTVSEILDSASAETEIIVLDENGEALPLVSVEASEIVQVADPIWCPASVAVPVSGGSGCSPSFTSMTALLGWLSANDPGMAGTIWIEGIYDSSSVLNAADNAPTSFTLDGSVGNLDNMANFALTIKGGWNGIGTGTVNTANPSRFEGDSLSIINWKGNITISDILVNNASVNPNAEASSLYIDTEGNVTLNRVEASNSTTLNGSVIDNVATGKSSTVTVTNSSFDYNNFSGLSITSNGNVTVSDSEFNGSLTSDGLRIINTSDITPSTITVTRSVFDGNGNGTNDYGLEVISNGVVTLTDLTSTNNAARGASIQTIANTAGTANVVLNGLSIFNNNGASGLFILTNSAITIKHLVALDNTTFGAYLDTTNADANLLVKTVSISGSAQLNNNGATGLYILSNGAVTLNNITANSNAGDGASIDANTAHSNSTSAVTLKGSSTFNNNTGTGLLGNGLSIEADGNIAVNNLTAIGNLNNIGVRLDNSTPLLGASPSVTVTGFLTAVGNDFGVLIQSVGVVTTTNLTTNSNDDIGTYILNSGASAPKTVTLNGVNIFNENFNAGLYISSKGAVTLNNITANGGTGEAVGAIIFNDISSTNQQNVTLKGTNTFNDNGYQGLQIVSYGMVTLSNVTANNNGNATNDITGDGVHIKNTGGTLTKPVTLTGFGNFADNDGNGLLIESNGIVTTNNLFATGNDDNGVLVMNTGGSTSAVTLNGVNNFSFNGSDGLSVTSDGVITLSKATSNNNTGFGIMLDNETAVTDLGITLIGFTTANGNSDTGVDITTRGTVLASTLTANINLGMGVRVDNSQSTTYKPVTITGNNIFQNNGDAGLTISSDGIVTLNNIFAEGNGVSDTSASGVVILNNTDPSKPQNVTLNGFNVFNKNAMNGLKVDSCGVVFLNNITANQNGFGVAGNVIGDGIYIENECGVIAKPVTIKGINQFNGNDGIGLYVNSGGAVNIYNIMANSNYTGVIIQNTGSSQAPIVISGYGFFSNNSGIGLTTNSNGAFTATNLSAIGNGTGGANINTVGLTKTQSVALKGNNTFDQNGGTGLIVYADGNITVSNINANNNALTGVELDNKTNWLLNSFAGHGSVTQTGFINANNNLSTNGVFIKTHGNLVLNYATANDNTIGVNLTVDGNATLTCTNTHLNNIDGLKATIGGNLTLKGLFAYLNSNDENLTVTGTTTRTVCP